MDWGQQRTSEGKLCGKKGSSVVLIWWLGKGKCKSPLSTEFLHHEMETLSQDDLSWNVLHDQQQSSDDALTSAWQSFLMQKGLCWLPSLGHHQVLLCVLPSPSQLEAMGSLGNSNHPIKMSLSLSILRHLRHLRHLMDITDHGEITGSVWPKSDWSMLLAFIFLHLVW